MKEKGENLTSERLARLNIEDMVKTVLKKSGIVSFARALRIIQDALIVQGNQHLLSKETIFAHLKDNSSKQDCDKQTFIAASELVFPDPSQR